MNCQKNSISPTTNILLISKRLWGSSNLSDFASWKVSIKREAENPVGWKENESALSQGLLDKQLREKLWRSWTYHTDTYWNSILFSLPQTDIQSLLSCAFPHAHEKTSPFCVHMCKSLHVAAHFTIIILLCHQRGAPPLQLPKQSYPPWDTWTNKACLHLYYWNI